MRASLAWTIVLSCVAAPVLGQQQLSVPLRSVVYLQSEQSRGAGVIISSDGLVLTSTRSVARGRDISATLYAGPGEEPLPVPARVVARDDWFTILQLDGQSFRVAPLGSTLALKMDDPVAILDEQGGAFTMAVAPLGAVAPLNSRASNLQQPLLVRSTWSGISAGGPVFDAQGRVVGLLQGPAEGNFGGTRALRIEDALDFMVRSKDLFPPRALVISGTGLTAASELIAETALPLTLRYKPGDKVTLRLKRGANVCGVLRPDLTSLEPLRNVTVGGGQPVGTLEVNATPPGALVSMDGAPLGKAPLTLDCMGPGSYRIKLTAKHHETSEQTVVVRAGEATSVSPFLRKLGGLLRVASSPPGGQVWVDGTFLGHTPLLDAPVVPGTHVVSVRFPGGARMRKQVVVEDRKILNLGSVDLPPPGALLSLEHTGVTTVYIDGHAQQKLSGHVVLTPGIHVVQAKDELGNVLQDTWDAPEGGYRQVRFYGGSSNVLPGLHGLGVGALVVGGLVTLVGVALAAGIPLGAVLGGWALGGLLDVLHRRAWIPALALGGVTAVPVVVLGLAVVALGVALAPPWERLLAEGAVIPAGKRDTPLPFVPTAGWEPRPVAPPVDDDAPPPADAPAAIVPKQDAPDVTIPAQENPY